MGVNICSDGFVCCEADCVEYTNPGGGTSSSASDVCENCLLVGGYIVNDPDSVPPGCSGNISDLEVLLTKNNYDACEGGDLSFKIKHHDDYFEDVSIAHVDGTTRVYLTIVEEVPHMKYGEIIYSVICMKDGKKQEVWGRIRVASKHNCLDCEHPENCDECANNGAGECNDIDVGVV